MPRSAAGEFSARLLTAAVRAGVRDLVVCPGSRSQALALAAAELERLGAVRLHVRIDERSAGFFALGLAIETGRAVPVITTSGTAVANLHPAVLEAFHAGVPLVALTADRPAELVGVGANQATTQPGIFGPLVPVVHRPAPVGGADEPSDAQTLGLRIARVRGPLHVNLALREPLAGAMPDLRAMLADPAPEPPDREPSQAPQPGGRGAGGRRVEKIRLDPGDGVPTLVLAGTGAGPEAERIAHEAGWPLIAEVASGARFGRNLVVPYRELLDRDSPEPGLRDAVRRVVVLGRPTLSRQIPRLLARPGIEAVVLGGTGGEAYDPARSVRVFAERAELSGHRGPREWLRDWVLAGRRLVAAASSDAPAPALAEARSTAPGARARFARAELAVARQPIGRAELVDAVWRASWPHDRLVLGASRLIRELDRRATGKRIRVVANRGLAGIDGTVATALGVATGSQLAEADGTIPAGAAGVTRVLLGDLTLLHDAGSLLVGQGGEPAPRVQLIVGDDGGGTIFDGLEVARVAEPRAMTRVQLTPQRVELASLAAAYGWTHLRASDRAGLEAALTSPEPRLLVEVPLPR